MTNQNYDATEAANATTNEAAAPNAGFMIGAIVLTHRRRVGNRRQDIGVQVARTPAGTLGVGKAGLGQGVEL